ncbi:MAG: four-carbon acid sugar kinase family protein [Firmicutes bacterium]|nr:four-carbon acid sugar kinase family protein [Bacillota bacterium]
MRAATRLGVIADDLTGANDTGVQFAKYGLCAMVVLDINSIDALANQADVIVIDTDSRWSDPRTAYNKVRAAAEVLKKAGISTVYKKIDSTLRGNVGAEIDAVMDVLQAVVAFVVPAFPATGRVTVDGKQLLRNVPLDKTEVASDLLSPVVESHIPTLLVRQTWRKVGHVPLEVVKAGAGALQSAFRDRVRAREQVIVVDASEQADLRTIAEAIASLDVAAVTVGSAGLAAEIPVVLGMVPRNERQETNRGRRGVLIIGGSVSPTARAQLEYAVAALDLPTVIVSAEDILSGLDTEERKTLEIVRKACSTLSKGRDLVLFLKPKEALESPGPCPDSCQQIPSSRYVEDSRRITGYLGMLASKILSICNVAGLVLTGGDTAVAVCKALGATGVALLEEIVPGVPSGHLVGGPQAGLMIVTKAGSFGDKDVIVRAIRYIHHDTR